jgi:hypothetical protein
MVAQAVSLDDVYSPKEQVEYFHKKLQGNADLRLISCRTKLSAKRRLAIQYLNGENECQAAVVLDGKSIVRLRDALNDWLRDQDYES